MTNAHLSPEVEAYFAKKGCKTLLQSTPEAIHVFDRSHAKKIGLFRNGRRGSHGCISARMHPTNAMAHGQRSISPNTISSEPRIAVMSASMCPRLRKSIAWRCANEGARILHLYGRLVPSDTR